MKCHPRLKSRTSVPVSLGFRLGGTDNPRELCGSHWTKSHQRYRATGSGDRTGLLGSTGRELSVLLDTTGTGFRSRAEASLVVRGNSAPDRLCLSLVVNSPALCSRHSLPAVDVRGASLPERHDAPAKYTTKHSHRLHEAFPT